MPIAMRTMNCFNCGAAIRVGDTFYVNRSGRIACDYWCSDSDDQESFKNYNEWAKFNGVTPLSEE